MSIVGIDLGDERASAVTVDETGRILARSTATARSNDLADAVRAVYRTVRPDDTPATALGVALPFQRDAIPTVVSDALAGEAGGVTPVTIKSGLAEVLAESWCGAAQGFSHVVAFAVREHVTAGILVDRKPLTGANGHAGSVAWLALNPVEREDYRRRGGLEAEIAAAGIVRRLVWRVKSGDRSSVVDRANGDLARVTSQDILTEARGGDGVCLSVVRETAKYVGMAVANLCTVIDPECVVLGGTIAASGDLMFDAIRTECVRRLRPTQADRVRIVLSTLGDDAVALGAARAALLQRQ
jgi:glucokinase